MDSIAHETSDTVTGMNCGDEVRQSLHFVNQHINHVNSPSNYRNQAGGEIDSNAALQQTDLTNSNYKESKV